MTHIINVYEHFVCKMREFSVLHATDPSFPILRLESSLYDDCESSFPIEPNVVDDAPSNNLEEVFDHPLISFASCCSILF